MIDVASRKLLILDLDETLLYANERPLARPANFEVAAYHVYLRPGLEAFLDAMSGVFRLAVWTSSSPAYASAICERVFAYRHALEFVWARDRCTPERDFILDSWSHAKRLRKVRRRGYALDHVLMVDDSPEKHTRNYGNLVRVTPFTGDPADDELPALATYLHSLADVPNVRAVEKRFWRKRLMSAAG
jgi:carboxy-terminal domain RNA polymerase II polypeptide A small phosphatase